LSVSTFPHSGSWTPTTVAFSIHLTVFVDEITDP
jgi:hypothetical protein